MRLFDTHSHLTDARFDNDRDTLIPSLTSHGIERVVDIACDTDELESVLSLSRKYDFIYSAAGIHPHNAGGASYEKLDILRDAFNKNSKLVAVGEIGLDYHYDLSPRSIQREWFARQLEFARSLDKPVILHIREAFGDFMDILRAYKYDIHGVMHCFSGSKETAFTCLDIGLDIAFGGSLTFSNAKNLANVASSLPLDRIVLETDCPYMTPTPYRGQRNDPTYIIYTARKLAELKGLDADMVAEQTYANSLNLFRI